MAFEVGKLYKRFANHTVKLRSNTDDSLTELIHSGESVLILEYYGFDYIDCMGQRTDRRYKVLTKDGLVGDLFMIGLYWTSDNE